MTKNTNKQEREDLANRDKHVRGLIKFYREHKLDKVADDLEEFMIAREV